MDGQSRDDVERRLIETESVVERCMCDKTGKKKVTIRGYAALFNSDSQDLGGFVEAFSGRKTHKIIVKIIFPKSGIAIL